MQIHFNTATFDDIERDKKIKTEAQLSLIGGTMGLLTGFSIISGVEIVFFLTRSVDKYIYMISCGLNATVKSIVIFRLICSLNIITDLWLKLKESVKAFQQRLISRW